MWRVSGAHIRIRSGKQTAALWLFTVKAFVEMKNNETILRANLIKYNISCLQVKKTSMDHCQWYLMIHYMAKSMLTPPTNSFIWRCPVRFRSELCAGQSSSFTPDSVNHFYLDLTFFTRIYDGIKKRLMKDPHNLLQQSLKNNSLEWLYMV